MGIEPVGQAAKAPAVQYAQEKGRQNGPTRGETAAAEVQAANKQVSEKEVIKAIEKANKALEVNYTHLQFAIHEQTKEIMVKVIDEETGEVIREIPPEKVLDAVAKMWELSGIFVDNRA